MSSGVCQGGCAGGPQKFVGAVVLARRGHLACVGNGMCVFGVCWWWGVCLWRVFVGCVCVWCVLVGVCVCLACVGVCVSGVCWWGCV